MHGQFVWYDLMTSDPAAAQRYYPPITGWKTQKFEQSSPDMPYTMWTVDGEPVGGVAQITQEQAAMGVKPSWLPSVHVNNIDESTRKVTSLGGKVVHGPNAIPDMGRYAIISDPQGATIALYQPNGPTRGFDGTPSIGRFSWNELMTTDYKRAFDFYRQLFGWEQTGEAMDMGGGNMYLMYGMKGKMFGGIFNRDAANMPNMPPNWLPYVYVKDIKQTVDAATRAGGKLGRGPMDIPGGGMIAILADPPGARFALHQGPSQTAARPKAAAKPQAKAKTKAKAKKAKATPKARAKAKRAAKSKPRPRAKAKAKKRSKRR
jgi:hypothetical protein